MKYFDENYESSRENKIYNMTLQDNVQYESITVEDIQKGKYLRINENKDGKIVF